uniref:gasdermin-D n=1 Tax=Panthera onca TaxID=9690 RepID=UPI0029530DD7|nr:gasdermin-D [Panthera onca]
MTSTFERVVKSVVRELDPKGDLIPVDSLRSSTSFRPYCLLGRKLSSSWFWKPRYKCLNLSIKDILEPDAPEPGTLLGTESGGPRVGGERTGQPAACSGRVGCVLSKDKAPPLPGYFFAAGPEASLIHSTNKIRVTQALLMDLHITFNWLLYILHFLKARGFSE